MNHQLLISVIVLLLAVFVLVLLAILVSDLLRPTAPKQKPPENRHDRGPRAYLWDREVEIINIGPAFVTVRYLDSGDETVAKKDQVEVRP